MQSKWSSGCGVSGFLFLKMFHPLLLVRDPILCETRPRSARGGRGELSHHALDDRHEGGAKSGARGAVGFGRVVPSSIGIHFTFSPGAAGTRRKTPRTSPKGFSCTCWNAGRLTGVDRLKGKFRSFLLASFQNHLSDVGRSCPPL